MAQLKPNKLLTPCSVLVAVVLACCLTIIIDCVESVSAGQVRGGRIEGIVVSADTDTPLAHETVWLLPEPDSMARAPSRTTQTEEQGRFVFDGVTSACYHLSVGREGYITRIYPDPNDGDQLRCLEVAEGVVFSSIRMNVKPGAKISGIVQNEQGKPLSGFMVKLFHLRDDGSYFLIADTQTDQSGRYYLDRVLPKTYVLRAERAKSDKGDTAIEVGYYGNAASFEGAAIIDVSPGAALTGVDVIVNRSAPSAVISGVVTDSQTGEPLPGVRVFAQEKYEYPPSNSPGAITAADGTYRLRGLLPGRYYIKTEATKVGDGYKMGFKELSVTDRHIIDFALIPAPVIIATVQYVGAGQRPGPNDYAVSLDFNCRNCATHSSQPYRREERFEFRGFTIEIAPVRIGVGFISLRYKLDRVLLGERDITGQWLELKPGEKLTDVRVLITDR
jgi:hypothetical protein